MGRPGGPDNKLLPFGSAAFFYVRFLFAGFSNRRGKR